MTVLNLDSTQVTVDGLLKLRDLKKLSVLTVSDVKLSDADLARLRAAMSEVQIHSPSFADFTAANPNDPSITATVATSLALRGKLEEAFALLEKAYEKEPSPAIYHAAVQILGQNPDKATDAQKKMIDDWLAAAIQQAPDSVELKLILVDFRDIEGRFGDSAKLYHELLARSDLNKRQRATIQNNLAYILVTGGRERDLAEAQALVDAAVAHFGPVAGVLDTRGLIHLAQGDAKAAVADFQIAVADSPTALNYFHLAVAEETSGNAVGAAEAFAKADALKLDAKLLSPNEQRNYQRLKDKAAKRGKP